MQLFNNFSVSTLASGCTSTDVTITVVDGSVFPTSGDFVVRIDNEFLKVTNRSGNTLTVVRAQDGSTAASHSSAAQVTQVVTESVLTGYRQDNCTNVNASSFALGGEGRVNIPDDVLGIQRDSGLLITGIGPFSKLVKPVLADFSWTNQGTASASDTAAGIFMLGTTTAGQDAKILDQAAPSTPYTITARIHGHRYDRYNACGILFRDSVSGRFHGIQYVIGGATSPSTEIVKFTNPTTYNSSGENVDLWDMLPSPTWLRIKNDATNLYFYYSNNGLRFRLLGQSTVTGWLTNAPNRVGWWTNSTSTTLATAALLSHWEIG